MGAELFFDCLRAGQYKPSAHSPTHQESTFGWIVAGSENTSQVAVHTFVAQTIPGNGYQLEEQLAKFWKLEEIENKRMLQS